MNNFTKQRVLAEAKFHRFMAEGFIPLNIWAVRILGTDASVMLAALYEEYNYEKYSGKLGAFNEIKLSVARAKEVTGLSLSRQNKAIKVLSQYGIVGKVIRSNVQKSRHFQFNFSLTNKLLYDMEELIAKDKKEKADRIKKHNEIQDKIAAWNDSHPKTEGMAYSDHESFGIKQVPHTPDDLPF